jgi:release factor glutamine methyltransferase
LAELSVPSLGGALATARERLTAAGCDTPWLDAELLLGEALGVSRERLVLDRDVPLEQAAAARFEALLRRREAREPVAYILGRRDFRRLTLHVDSRVLVPRPETELLVEVALTLPHDLTVLDVGTGSGAVALAVKDERPDLSVRGTDVSADALTVARENGSRLGLDVEWARGDLRDGGTADAVLANLPYVPEGAALAPEITRYEPHQALFSGKDGLDLIRRLIAGCDPRRERAVALEIGPEQALEVERLLQGRGYVHVEALCDLAGLERVVVARQ